MKHQSDDQMLIKLSLYDDAYRDYEMSHQIIHIRYIIPYSFLADLHFTTEFAHILRCNSWIMICLYNFTSNECFLQACNADL